MKATELRWGLKDNDLEAPVMWGARMIVQERLELVGGAPKKRAPMTTDLVWDRQGAVTDSPAAELALGILIGKLNGGGALDRFRTHVETKDLADPDLRGEWTDEPTDVRFRYATNRSHGYLYVTAWLVRTS